VLAPRFIDKPLAGVDCEGGSGSSHASVVTRGRQLDHLGDETILATSVGTSWIRSVTTQP
jgi:hypothetical protein